MRRRLSGSFANAAETRWADVIRDRPAPPRPYHLPWWLVYGASEDLLREWWRHHGTVPHWSCSLEVPASRQRRCFKRIPGNRTIPRSTSPTVKEWFRLVNSGERGAYGLVCFLYLPLLYIWFMYVFAMGEWASGYCRQTDRAERLTAYGMYNFLDTLPFESFFVSVLEFSCCKETVR